jgi:hypothetical protein
LPRALLGLGLITLLLMAYSPEVQAAGSPADQPSITIYRAQVIKVGEAQIKAQGPSAHASRWVSALSTGGKPKALKDEAQLNQEWQGKTWTGIILEMEFSTAKQTKFNAETFVAQTASGKSAGPVYAMFLIDYPHSVVIKTNIVPATVTIGEEEFQCVPREVRFSKTKTVSSNLMLLKTNDKYDGILLYRKPKTKLRLGLLFPGQPADVTGLEFLGTSVKVK